MRIQAHGLAVETTARLDARIYRRAPELAEDVTRPIVHLCTVAMPTERGDYGSGAVDRLSPEDVFVSLVEFGPGEVDTPLFATKGRPTSIDPDDFDPNALQRVQNGQSGKQYFFTEAGRAFCLYVVLGSHANRRRLAATAATMVQSLQIGESGGDPLPAPKVGVAGLNRARKNHFHHS
ncbi:MAG: hypothetical protein ACK5MT_19000 [Actinomycetales bacterium]